MAVKRNTSRTPTYYRVPRKEEGSKLKDIPTRATKDSGSKKADVKLNPNRATTRNRNSKIDDAITQKLKDIPTRKSTASSDSKSTKNLSSFNVAEYDKNITKQAYAPNYDPVRARHEAQGYKEDALRWAKRREDAEEIAKGMNRANARDRSVKKAKATAKKTEDRKRTKK